MDSHLEIVNEDTIEVRYTLSPRGSPKVLYFEYILDYLQLYFNKLGESNFIFSTLWFLYFVSALNLVLSIINFLCRLSCPVSHCA